MNPPLNWGTLVRCTRAATPPPLFWCLPSIRGSIEREKFAPEEEERKNKRGVETFLEFYFRPRTDLSSPPSEMAPICLSHIFSERKKDPSSHTSPRHIAGVHASKRGKKKESAFPLSFPSPDFAGTLLSPFFHVLPLEKKGKHAKTRFVAHPLQHPSISRKQSKYARGGRLKKTRVNPPPPLLSHGTAI